MTPMALNLKQRRYVETVLAGLPHLAEAVAAIPPDWQPAAFQAAERSYLKGLSAIGAFRATNLGFFGHAPVASPSSGGREGEADKII